MLKTNLGITEKGTKHAVELQCKGFAVTVDAIRMGKRERDLRLIIGRGGSYPFKSQQNLLITDLPKPKS
jgi:hypothetical protein